MIQPLFDGVAAAINRALQTDPATLAKLAKLEGLVYAVHCTLPPLNLCFRLNKDGVEILTSEESAQVTLKGSAMALVRLLADAAQETGSISQSGVEITGDATALLQLSRAFADLEIDWEELLSRIIGDVAARAVTQTIKQTRDWESRNRPRHMSAVKQFTQDQLGLVPTEQVRALSEHSRELQYRLDRLEARIKLLSQQDISHAD